MIQITRFPTGSSGRIIYLKNDVPMDGDDAQAEVDAGTAEFIEFDFRPKARLWVISAMDCRFNDAVNADIEFPVRSGVFFNGDQNSRILIDGEITANAIKAGRQETVSPTWFAKDNTPVNMTRTELENLGLALRDRYEAAVICHVGHVAALEAETDLGAIENYDFSAGWPV